MGTDQQLSWPLHCGNGTQPITSVGVSPEPGKDVRIHVRPVLQSMRNVCRAAMPEVNMTNRALSGLDIAGRPRAGIFCQVTSSYCVATNWSTSPVYRSNRNVHLADIGDCTTSNRPSVGCVIARVSIQSKRPPCRYRRLHDFKSTVGWLRCGLVDIGRTRLSRRGTGQERNGQRIDYPHENRKAHRCPVPFRISQDHDTHT